MKSSLLPFVASAALLCGSANVYAAPVAKMACSGNTPNIGFNVSAYNLGIEQTLNIGSQSSGSGAGKVVFNPLDVHASIAQFREFYIPAAEGKLFNQCTLTATGPNGTSVELIFKKIAVKTVTIAAQNAASANQEAAAYTDIQFEYAELDVKTTGGVDDGGTDGGWNRVTNTPTLVINGVKVPTL